MAKIQINVDTDTYYTDTFALVCTAIYAQLMHNYVLLSDFKKISAFNQTCLPTFLYQEKMGIIIIMTKVDTHDTIQLIQNTI